MDNQNKRKIIREYAKALLSNRGWTNVFNEKEHVFRFFDDAEVMYAEEEKRYGVASPLSGDLEEMEFGALIKDKIPKGWTLLKRGERFYVGDRIYQGKEKWEEITPPSNGGTVGSTRYYIRNAVGPQP